MHLEINKFDYLKTPKCSWTLHNDEGGSFSNSGMQSSIRKAAQHFHALNRNISPESMKVAVRHIVDFDSQGVPFYELEPLTTLDQILGA